MQSTSSAGRTARGAPADGTRLAQRTVGEPNVKLYSYFRSSAAYRARIALNLKGLDYDTAPVHLVKDGGHQLRPEFRAINPQKRVPALQLAGGEILLQSLALIDYLEETKPVPALLPADPLARARVRAVAQIIA